MPILSREYASTVDDKQPVDRELEMVRVYAAPTPVEVELVEAAFRAHGLPYVIRYKLGYMQPTFAGDQLRMSRLLVHRSKVAEAQALLMSLGLGESEDEGPSARERFEVLLDGVGARGAKPLDEKLWAVVPENFGDWMLGSLPDLFDRLSVDAVLGILEPLDAPDQGEHRAALVRALADAPVTTRNAILDALEDGRAPEPRSLRAALLKASAAT